MRTRFAACVLILLGAVASAAAAEDGCDRFAWPVDREMELFGEGFFADVESQTALPKDGAFSMLLQPIASVIYTVAPAKGRDDGYGGIVTMEWIAAGRYQITLSGDNTTYLTADGQVGGAIGRNQVHQHGLALRCAQDERSHFIGLQLPAHVGIGGARGQGEARGNRRGVGRHSRRYG